VFGSALGANVCVLNTEAEPKEAVTQLLFGMLRAFSR
jgi:hypothetical protein